MSLWVLKLQKHSLDARCDGKNCLPTFNFNGNRWKVLPQSSSCYIQYHCWIWDTVHSVASIYRYSYQSCLSSWCTISDENATKPFTVKDNLWFRDALLIVPDVYDLRKRCISLHHDTPYAGHLGLKRTLDLVSRHFLWPGVHVDVKEYVTLCDICQRTKVSTQKPLGLLHPLQIPERRWISMLRSATRLMVRLNE